MFKLKLSNCTECTVTSFVHSFCVLTLHQYSKRLSCINPPSSRSTDCWLPTRHWWSFCQFGLPEDLRRVGVLVKCFHIGRVHQVGDWCTQYKEEVARCIQYQDRTRFLLIFREPAVVCFSLFDRHRSNGYHYLLIKRGRKSIAVFQTDLIWKVFAPALWV